MANWQTFERYRKHFEEVAKQHGSTIHTWALAGDVYEASFHARYFTGTISCDDRGSWHYTEDGVTVASGRGYGSLKHFLACPILRSGPVAL